LVSFDNGSSPDGIIVVMDSSQGFKKNDREIIDKIISRKIPHVIFANKQDIGDHSLNNHFNDSLIIPTIATESIGISDGFRLLLKYIKPNKDINKITENLVKIKHNTRSNRSFNDNDMFGKMKDALEPSDNHDICSLKISMHPLELDNVVEVLKDKGFSNLTVIKTKLVDNNASKEIYRGFKLNTNLKIRVDLVMIIKSDDVKYVLNAIESIKTDEIDDHIIIKPIQEVIRLSTLEKNEIAID
jgi:nitrogen regulatory protein PII